MPNSDTQDGVFNKQTKEIRYYYVDGEAGEAVVTQSFSGNVETAKSTFFTADALTNFDTNATQLEWAITADGNGLKFTIAFGTKGASVAEADDWAKLWHSTKTTLEAADNYVKLVSYTIGDGSTEEGGFKTANYRWDSIDATPHLF